MLDEKALEAARQAWLESASDYTRLDVSIRTAILAYEAAKPKGEVSCVRYEAEPRVEALEPFAGDTMPRLQRTEIAYDQNGLRRCMSPMEFAMLRARSAAAATRQQRGSD